MLQFISPTCVLFRPKPNTVVPLSHPELVQGVWGSQYGRFTRCSCSLRLARKEFLTVLRLRLTVSQSLATYGGRSVQAVCLLCALRFRQRGNASPQGTGANCSPSVLQKPKIACSSRGTQNDRILQII